MLFEFTTVSVIFWITLIICVALGIRDWVKIFRGEEPNSLWFKIINAFRKNDKMWRKK